MTWIRQLTLVVSVFTEWAIVCADDPRPVATEITVPGGDVLPEHIKAQVQRTYQRAQSATTAEDYAAIIDLCQQLKQVPLGRRAAVYINRLASWAHNQRGELLADEANTAEQEGDDQCAADLEQQALADFDSAVRLDRRAWRAIHNRGVSRAKLGRFEAAIRDLSVTLQLRPQHADAWFNRAEIRTQLGRYREAVDDYTQALKRTGDDAGMYAGRGYARIHLQRYDDARADFDKSLQLQSDSAAIYADRAVLHATEGRWEDAAKDFRTAIQLDDQLGRAYRGAAWLMATCPVARIRDADLALGAAQKAIALDGADGIGYLDTLAAAQAESGQFQQACATLAKAIESAPEEVAERLRCRLKLYEDNRPYREPRTAQRTAAFE